MMHAAKNAEPASWIPSRLHPFALDVGSIIPDGFAAYARVLHPPYRLTPAGNQTPVRWRDIAAANNRTVAAEMQLLDISSQPTRFSASGDELWDQQTQTGNLPREIAERLAAILPSHTLTPELCWFGVWEGFGDLRIEDNEGAMFSVPHRDLFLFHGRVGDVLATFSEIDWIYRSRIFGGQMTGRGASSRKSTSHGPTLAARPPVSRRYLAIRSSRHCRQTQRRAILWKNDCENGFSRPVTGALPNERCS